MADMGEQGPVIVVGVDGSDRSAALLRWAAAHARLTGGRLRAVLAWRLPELPEFVPFRAGAELVAAAERRLQSLVTSSVDGVQVEFSVVEGDPARVLLHAAQDADLLVIGRHAENRDTAHGAVVLQCAAFCPCTLTIVPLP